MINCSLKNLTSESIRFSVPRGGVCPNPHALLPGETRKIRLSDIREYERLYAESHGEQEGYWRMFVFHGSHYAGYELGLSDFVNNTVIVFQLCDNNTLRVTAIKEAQMGSPFRTLHWFIRFNCYREKDFDGQEYVQIHRADAANLSDSDNSFDNSSNSSIQRDEPRESFRGIAGDICMWPCVMTSGSSGVLNSVEPVQTEGTHVKEKGQLNRRAGKSKRP